MRHWQQGVSLLRNRKRRRESMLRKMVNLRAAKMRKRMACPLPEAKPKLSRWFPLELGIRDKQTGETAWIDLRSGRDAARRLAVLLRHYQPGLRSTL